MARDFGTLPNRDTTDLTNYPKGRLKDDALGVNGTPVDEQAYGDIQQLMIRALLQGNITPNGNPDNVANGYQLAQAFGLEAWHDGAGISMGATGGGSATPDPVGNRYNKIWRVGKTFTWQLSHANIVISGTVSAILLNMEPYLSATTFANDHFRFTALSTLAGVTSTLLCELDATAKQIIIKPFAGGNFTVGGGLGIHLNLTAELT